MRKIRKKIFVDGYEFEYNVDLIGWGTEPQYYSRVSAPKHGFSLGKLIFYGAEKPDRMEMKRAVKEAAYEAIKEGKLNRRSYVQNFKSQKGRD